MLMNSKSINVNQPVKRTRSGGGRPFHSRLEPFVEFIREQRQQRKAWQEIAERSAPKRIASSRLRDCTSFTGAT